MTNKEISRLLDAISVALEVKGKSRFRVIAYDRAATSVEHATSEVKDLWDDNQLETLSGIGTSIASHLNELFCTGKVKHFEKIMSGLPPAMFEMLRISGIGGKTAYKLCKRLGIKKAKNAISKLKEAAENGKIRVIDGFGEESEKNILEGINELERQEDRILLSIALSLADKIVSYLKKEKTAQRIDLLGSLRRKVATVGDIDIGAATVQPGKIIDHFVSYPETKKLLASGKNTARVLLKNGYQVDLKTQKPKAYGAMLQHFTGSKHHNIHLREIAQKKNLSLSEYGIKRDSKIQEFENEKEFYQALNMDWIPPELREDNGEIEKAAKGQLPQLVKLEQIKGDLQLHSDFPIEPSHDLGEDSMKTIVKKAKALNYEYIAFTEHNPSASQHSEKDIINLLKRKKEQIDKINYSNNKNTQNFKIFNSVEVDIKPNGHLTVPDKGMSILDFALVSVHSSFRLNRSKMTERILKALAHPKVKILAHPTGRMLNQREGYELNWEKIFQFCLKNKKILEINAHPKRLDLPDTLVREAVKKGVKMVISTDAHSVQEMDNMKFGVFVARRGWAGKRDILNTLSYAKIKKWLLS